MRKYINEGIGAKKIEIENATFKVNVGVKSVHFRPIQEKDEFLVSKIRMHIILEIQLNLNGVIFDKAEKRLIQIIENEEYEQLMKTL